MNSFYNEDELSEIGFLHYGKDVLISRKASIYGANSISIGDNVRIDDYCLLSGRIVIGSYVHIAAYSALYGGEKGIFISDYVNVSSRVSVYSINDDYSGDTLTNPMVPERYKNVKSQSVYIEKHVIIGSTCVILPGVTLAEGSAFGCFSFINHNSDPWTINVGIPFNKIRNRSKELLKKEQLLLHENDYNEV